MVHDGSYFAWCKGFAGAAVAHRLELLAERFAASYPQRQTVDGGARLTSGEVHRGQLPLGVRTYHKFFIHNLLLHVSFKFQVSSFRFQVIVFVKVRRMRRL